MNALNAGLRPMCETVTLSETPLIRAFNCDCMTFMAGLPDKVYQLSICDPPYGIGEDGGDKQRGRKADNYNKIVMHKKKEWDVKPQQTYFSELFRCSINQIVWGGNYFTNYLPERMGWVFWDKLIGGDFSDGELAWTSFNRALRQFTYSYHGDTRGGHIRIHPTQKPVALYRFLLTHYAKPGQTILDTHGGSFSSAIACWHEGYDMDIIELDPDYFQAACERFERETRQHKLFPTSGAK
jgi:site-specific DNA-methyltransferase (adenine-specific)